MPDNPMTPRLEKMNRRFAELRQEVISGEPLPVLEATLAELETALEELRVAEEEVMAARVAEAMQQQHYHTLFEFAPDAYLVTDLVGIIREANHAARHLLGRSIHGKFTRLIGKPLANWVVLEERNVFRSALSQLSHEPGIREWDTRLQSNGQKTFHASLRAGVEVDVSEVPIAIRWLIRDVTARQDTLLLTAERYRLVVEGMQDFAVILLDNQGNIVTWNPSAERILGYSEEEVQGQSGSIIFVPEDRARGADRIELETAARKGKAEDERWHLRKDGSRFWGSGVMSAVRDPEGNLRGFVKVMRDNTERRRAEEERIQHLARITERELQNAILQERNRMAQDIHDTLAQGFTGIFIQLEAAEDALDASEALHEHIVRARELARSSLMEARRSVQALRPYALEGRSLPDALAYLVELTTYGTTAQVSFQVEGNSFPLTETVEEHLLRIGQEALANALKYSQASRIIFTLSFATDEIVLRVEDNGIGFAAVTPDMPSPEVGPNPLGLRGIQERARRMGGSANILSQPGEGTRIEVQVPIAVARNPIPETG
jgi:PAS domain S-box-containing protein